MAVERRPGKFLGATLEPMQNISFRYYVLGVASAPHRMRIRPQGLYPKHIKIRLKIMDKTESSQETEEK